MVIEKNNRKSSGDVMVMYYEDQPHFLI